MTYMADKYHCNIFLPNLPKQPKLTIKISQLPLLTLSSHAVTKGRTFLNLTDGEKENFQIVLFSHSLPTKRFFCFILVISIDSEIQASFLFYPFTLSHYGIPCSFMSSNLTLISEFWVQRAELSSQAYRNGGWF